MTLRATLVAAMTAATISLSGGAAQAQNCAQVLAGIPELSDFVHALSRTGQIAALREVGPYTILAPNNAAIARMPIGLRNDVFGQGAEDSVDPFQGPAVVNAHIVDGKHTSASVQGTASATVRTRNGNELRVVRGADGRYALQPQGRGRRAVEGHVVRADIPCSNGVIHIVDTVLIR